MPEIRRGRLWVRALRAPFLVASVIPVALGAVFALHYLTKVSVLDPLSYRVDLLVLVLVGAVAVHLAANMLNDNFDYRSGNDLRIRHQNPFAGGGRVLTQGVLSVNTHLTVALGFLVLGSLIGLYLVFQVGLTLLWIGLIGVFVALFYVAPPIQLAHRGVGELLVGLSFGPLIVTGTYFVITLRVDLGPLLLSIAFGSLVAAILWINEFPDVEADLEVGKETLMARLGYETSIRVYLALVALAYVAVLVGVVLFVVPWPALLTLLTVPMARKTYRGLRANYADPMALIPANAGTIGLTVLFGLLAIVGLGVAILV